VFAFKSVHVDTLSSQAFLGIFFDRLSNCTCFYLLLQAFIFHLNITQQCAADYYALQFADRTQQPLIRCADCIKYCNM